MSHMATPRVSTRNIHKTPLWLKIKNATPVSFKSLRHMLCCVLLLKTVRPGNTCQLTVW